MTANATPTVSATRPVRGGGDGVLVEHHHGARLCADQEGERRHRQSQNHGEGDGAGQATNSRRGAAIPTG